MSHRRFRSMLILAAGLLMIALAPLAAAGPPTAKPPAAGSLFLYPERFALEDGSLGEAERGLLFVPVNRSEPDSKVISVELFRFPAQSDVAPEAPPIFVLRGGPGFEGLAPALQEPGFYEREIEQQTAFGDVIVVGQRGIGSSKPSTICEPARFPFALGKNCREFWEGQGLDLAGFTVIEAAADVRDLAAALGYRKIILTGGSFGSHWGMTVMRYHPEIVARALLTGMEGPDHTYDMPGWVLNSIERMAAAAEKSERLRGHIPEGGLMAGFRRALKQLEKGPVSVEVAHPETGEMTDVQFVLPQVRGMLYGYSGRISSRRGMPGWAADMIALANGDFSRAAKAQLNRQSDGDSGPRSYRTASYFMLDCGSGISPERKQQLDSDPDIPTIGNLGAFYDSACRAWDADLGDEFRQNFDTDIPTAIVHGTWDTNTPYENALELAPHFKNSKLVTVEGGSHGALGEAMRHSESFRGAIGHFLRTGDLSQLPEKVELPEIEWEIPRPR